jgi:hypothetical protein
MATVNTLTDIVSNLDATPKVINALNLMGAVVREQVGTVEIAAADDNNSVYRVGRVHSSWRVSEIMRFNDAITTGTDYNVGLYETAENGGAAKDENLFADAISLASASAVGVNDTFEALGVENIEKTVWEALGESSDPDRWYDLAYTGITVGSGAGTLSVRTRYVAGT